MPGQEKIVSVTIVPASRVPNCRPRMVMIGISALRKCVAKEDGTVLEAFGARGADVVARKLFEHRAAHHARQNGGERSAERGGRKNVIRKPPRPETGNNAQSQWKKAKSTAAPTRNWELPDRIK